jgi:hypothetical protein
MIWNDLGCRNIESLSIQIQLGNIYIFVGEKSIHIQHQITNAGETKKETMLYSIGGHPAF